MRADRRDHQLDVVLVHADWGVVDIEVKGHRMRVRDEAWCSDGRPLDPRPMQRADHEWWTTDAVAHLQGHWHHITERFDLL